MKLIWHIIKKDFTRDRWNIIIWALLFVAQIALGFVLLHDHGRDKDWIIQVQTGIGALIFVQVVGGYVLVARLVQADALLGSELFWVTRPISRARLLIAKALGALLIFGLLPVALLLPWWLYNGFGVRDIAWATVETVGWQLLVIAPAFLMASLTDDLGRVLLWTLLLVIGTMAWITLLQGLNVPLTLATGYGVGLTLTRVWVLCLMGLAGSALVIVHHYLTRRLARSAVLGYLGVGVIVLTGYLWTWDCSKALANISRPALAPAPAGLVEGLSIQTDSAWPKSFGRGGEPNSDLQVILDVQGLPADMSVYADDVAQTWHWPGSPVFKRDGNAGYTRSPFEVVLRKTYNLPVPVADPETASWYQAAREKQKQRSEEWRAKANAERAARGLPPVPRYDWNPKPRKDGLAMWVSPTLPNTVIAKMRPEPPIYTARVAGMITRPVIVAELPVKVGARAAGESETFHLVELTPAELGRIGQNRTEGFHGVLVVTTPSIRNGGLWLVGEIRGRNSWFFGRRQLLDVNHTTGNFSQMSMGKLDEARVGSVTIRWQEISIVPFTMIRDGKEVSKDPSWLEHTTMVVMGEAEVAPFIREVKDDRFAVEPGRDDSGTPAPIISTGKR